MNEQEKSIEYLKEENQALLAENQGLMAKYEELYQKISDLESIINHNDNALMTIKNVVELIISAKNNK